MWRDVEEFVALFSKCRWGDPYRIEFRNYSNVWRTESALVKRSCCDATSTLQARSLILAARALSGTR